MTELEPAGRAQGSREFQGLLPVRCFECGTDANGRGVIVDRASPRTASAVMQAHTDRVHVKPREADQ